MAPLLRLGKRKEGSAFRLARTDHDRYIWELLAQGTYSTEEVDILLGLQERITRCCHRSWETVKLILCDDSPEGHLPEDMEDIDGLDTRDLLSYSFRATIESRYVRSLAGP